MVARGRGLSRQELDQKRLDNQCVITPRNQRSNGQRRRAPREIWGKTMMAWTGPVCQRIKKRGSGVRVSATLGVLLRVREEKRGPGWLVGLLLLMGQIGNVGPFSFL